MTSDETQGFDPASVDWQSLFDELNGRHFAGRIPAYDVRIEGIEALGHCDVEALVIRLRPFSEHQMRGTLSHEMVHAFLDYLEGDGHDGFHGEDFQQEVRRLLHEGCPVDPDTYVDAVDGLTESEWRSIDQENFDFTADSPVAVPLMDVSHLMAPDPATRERAADTVGPAQADHVDRVS